MNPERETYLPSITNSGAEKGREGFDFNSESRKGDLSVKVETRALTLSRVGSAQTTGRSIALVSVGSSLADTYRIVFV